jgi:hypothetical protein
MGTWGPNFERIGIISREIEVRVRGMGANGTGHGSGLEKRRGRPFFESRRQGDDRAGVWTNLDACKHPG